MKKSFLIAASAACLMTGSLKAQFQYSYGSTVDESTPAVQNTVDNGYIAAGRTNLPAFGGGDATLIKTDVNGNQLWSKIYGGTGADQFNSVKETPAAGLRYVAVGSTNSYSGSEDGYFVATDVNGNPFVTKVFGGLRIDRFNHIQKINHPVDGPGYIIVGESNSYNFFGTEFDIYVVRTDLNGNLKAAAVVGTKGDQTGNWIEETNDGYIIAGSTTYNCTPSPTGLIQKDIYAVKLDFNLNLVWDRVFGNNNVLRDDAAFGVKVDNVGNYVFTGETQSYGVSGGDIFLLKTTPFGGLVFFKTYGGGRNDQGKSLVVHKTTTGVFYVVTGNTSSFNSTANPDAFLLKTDANGNHVSTFVYGRDKPDFTNEIIFSSPLNNGFVLAGNEFSFGAGGSDAYLVKTDVNGKTGNPCEKNVIPTVIQHAPCIYKGAQVVKVENNKVVPSAVKTYQYAINKCYIPVIVVPAESARMDENEYLNIESTSIINPNPASSFINLRGLAALKDANVSIKDMNGRNMKDFTLNGEDQSISIEDLEKGVYLVIITKTDGSVVKEKLVIQ
jgi:hypothetical protein